MAAAADRGDGERMRYLRPVTFVLLAALVVAAHVALWRSPDWPTDLKLRLTVLNAIGWAVVILPAFAVARWARAHGQGGGAADGGRDPGQDDA